jgi:hypothetical protein
MKLLSTSNTKIKKGEKFGWRTYGLSLSPAGKSGKQFCPHRSAGCEAACLDTSGMGVFSNVQDARLAKSRFFIEDREGFLAQLDKELRSVEKWGKKNQMPVAVRPNVLSDLPWHNLIDMEAYPTIQFYDYTPNPSRMIQFVRGMLPKNYHLTFSRKESNGSVAEMIANMGGNVAVVFDELPDSYFGKSVINGDESDLRFLDPAPCIVGLKAKGKARKDTSGFVVQTLV